MKRRLASIIVGLVALVAVTAAPVHAGSTVSGSLNGHQCYGSVTYGSNYARATTTFGRGNSYIYAYAAVFCYVNGNPVMAGYAAASNSSGGTTTTAYRDSGFLAQPVCGGKGFHINSYDSYSWTGSTSVGIVGS